MIPDGFLESMQHVTLMNNQNYIYSEFDVKPPVALTYAIFILVAGLVLPLVLIPLIKLVGYSEIVEEIAKALVVLFLILKLPNHKWQIIVGAVFGLLFGLSENMLYLTNIFQLGDFSVFWSRFILTVPMHIVTVLVMVLSGMASRWFLMFGFVAAIVLHIVINGIVVSF